MKRDEKIGRGGRKLEDVAGRWGAVTVSYRPRFTFLRGDV